MPLHIHPIRGVLGFSHLITETRGNAARALLIDAGPGCTPRKLSTLFARLKLRPADLRAIQLTHAHIDHCINAAAIQRWSGAPVFCPAADKPYLLEHARYRGLNIIGGALEAAGRLFWRYEPPKHVHYFSPAGAAMPLPHFPALHQIDLPGHTPGHTGYFIPETSTLIAGDLFAGAAFYAHPPPRIFTDDRHAALRSIVNAATLGPAQVFACHVLRPDGAQGALTLRKLAAKFRETYT